MPIARSVAVFLSLTLAIPAWACDMVPGPQVQFSSGEKVPGWVVWKFTPQSGVEGYMLTGHIRQRGFPPAAREKAFLEDRIGQAATGLFKRKPDSAALDGPSMALPEEAARFKTNARRFSLKLAFAGQDVSAPGYMRINPRRKDIALIVAFTNPGDAAAAAAVARNTTEHPGFDCTDGDGP